MSIWAPIKRLLTEDLPTGLGQDELGIWTSPDGKLRVAFFSDPDGNVLMLCKA